jgi:hypothetical protein
METWKDVRQDPVIAKYFVRTGEPMTVRVCSTLPSGLKFSMFDLPSSWALPVTRYGRDRRWFAP